MGRLEPVFWDRSRPLFATGSLRRQPAEEHETGSNSSLVGYLLNAERLEVARGLYDTAAVILAHPRLPPESDLGILISHLSLPQIRARKSLRVGELSNSSTQRHTKAALQRPRRKQKQQYGQHQRERPDPRLGLRVHDQALVHGY